MVGRSEGAHRVPPGWPLATVAALVLLTSTAVWANHNSPAAFSDTGEIPAALLAAALTVRTPPLAQATEDGSSTVASPAHT